MRDVSTTQQSLRKSSQLQLNKYLSASKIKIEDKELSYTKSDIKEIYENKSYLAEILKSFLPDGFDDDAISLLIQKIPESIITNLSMTHDKLAEINQLALQNFFVYFCV